MKGRFTCAATKTAAPLYSAIFNTFVVSLLSVSVVDPEVPVATTSALEEMALYSNKRKLRQGRRSLEAPVPT